MVEITNNKTDNKWNNTSDMYNSFMGIKEEENAIKAVSALIAGTAFTYL